MIVTEEEATVVSVARPGFRLCRRWPDRCGYHWIHALVDMLGGVADPRQARGVRHTIGAVLAVMVLAVLAGARSFREIADRAADLPPELLVLARCRVHRLTGRYMVPSAATMRRVAHDVDADAIDERVCAWLRAEAMATAIAAGAAGEAPGRLVAVAVDGKTIRNTCQPGSEGSEIKLFSALLHQAAIVIAQVRIPDGTNEITQVPALLAGVNLTDVVVTGDAAHAQQTTAAYLAIERAGHYALTVKGNQPGLLAQIAAALPAAVPGSEHHVTDDRSKGKIVRRAIWVAPAESIDFPGVLPRPDLDPKVKLPAPKLEENPQHRKWPDWFWTQAPLAVWGSGVIQNPD